MVNEANAGDVIRLEKLVDIVLVLLVIVRQMLLEVLLLLLDR